MSPPGVGGGRWDRAREKKETKIRKYEKKNCYNENPYHNLILCLYCFALLGGRVAVLIFLFDDSEILHDGPTYIIKQICIKLEC